MADNTHGADAHATEVAGHGAEAVGMPQLDFATFPNQIFWLVIALLAIYFILSKVALPRIAMVLAERRGTISNDIAAAEELKSQAVAAEEAYNKALAEARAESGRIIAEAKAEIQAELDAATAKADAEIQEKVAQSEKAIGEIRANAMTSVKEVAVSTTDALVTALGGKASEAAASSAVDAKMKG
ncbi:MAG: F0F1 ATP synthase subunit B' [Mangrovicoccus sp.]